MGGHGYDREDGAKCQYLNLFLFLAHLYLPIRQLGLRELLGLASLGGDTEISVR